MITFFGFLIVSTVYTKSKLFQIKLLDSINKLSTPFQQVINNLGIGY